MEILTKRRNAGQQVSSVVVLWVRINRASIGLFNNLTAEHDDDIMADMFHNCKIVRNKEVRKSELILEVLKQIHDLGLDADIEGANHLVADN